MNRYFYYMIFINMLVNVTVFVPKILLEHRYSGAIMSILVAAPVGTLLLYQYAKAVSAFPGKSFAEISSVHISKWFSSLLLGVMGIAWLFAGMISIIGYTHITKRFVNPDMSETVILLLFIAVLLFASKLRTDSVLNAVEIVLVVNIPIIILVFIQSIRNPYLKWDSMFDAVTHMWHLPSWDGVAAATYLFTGYVNMVVVNHIFQGKGKTFKFQPRYLISVGVLGLLVMINSYMIPIGIHGMAQVGNQVYPWVSTADSLRIEFGVVERVLYMFVLVYTTVTLTSSVIHWHVGVELLKNMRQQWKPIQHDGRWTWGILLLFAAVTLGVNAYIVEEDLFELSKFWLNLRLCFEVLVVAVMVYCARRERKRISYGS